MTIPRESLRVRCGLPPEARVLMAAGDYLRGDGMRMAVWAFDVLKYVAPDLHLILIGDGPERDRVRRFARSLGFDDDRVRFADDNPLTAAAEADLAWCTHPRGGLPFLRAALACGVPAVAVRTADTEALPGLILSPPGDPVGLATATRAALGRLAPFRPGAVT